MDQEKMEAFVGKVLGDTSATMTSLLAILGDRLGLFKDMAANGATTPAELASRTNTNERYAREWLGGMATAGYIDYDPASETFTMPEEHAPALAHEGGPVFFGGVYEMLPPLVGVLETSSLCSCAGPVPHFTTGGNAFHYLTTLMLHEKAVADSPSDWFALELSRELGALGWARSSPKHTDRRRNLGLRTRY